MVNCDNCGFKAWIEFDGSYDEYKEYEKRYCPNCGADTVGDFVSKSKIVQEIRDIDGIEDAWVNNGLDSPKKQNPPTIECRALKGEVTADEIEEIDGVYDVFGKNPGVGFDESYTLFRFFAEVDVCG